MKETDGPARKLPRRASTNMGKKLTLILLIVISLVLLLGALLIWRWNREISAGQAEAALFQAAQSDQGGVDINSAFIFTFADNVSSASVNKSLTVEPAIELGIHQGASRREVLVAPAEPLTPGALYKFTLKAGGQSYTWAVQTKADLRIMDYSPGDQGIDVPVSGDLTIVLNQMLELDLAKVGDYVTLTPETPGSWTQRGRVLCFNPEQPLLPATVYQVEIAAGLPAAQSSVTLTEGLRFSFETAPAQQDVGWQVSGPASFQSGETPTFSLSLAETPGETAAPPVLAGQLYQYQDADSYVQALLEIAVAKPIWSRGFQELKNCA